MAGNRGPLFLGLVGYFFPRTMGPGYETIADLLNGRAAIGLVVAILLLKPLVVLVALGSRTSGGTLAPLLMTGAAIGALFAWGVNTICPGSGYRRRLAPSWGWRLFLRASARAPLSLIFFAFELTRSFEALLPLMLVVVIAQMTSLSLISHSIMTLSLKRKGLPVHPEYEADVFHRVTVRSAMDSEFAVLPSTATVGRFWLGSKPTTALSFVTRLIRWSTQATYW